MVVEEPHCLGARGGSIYVVEHGDIKKLCRQGSVELVFTMFRGGPRGFKSHQAAGLFSTSPKLHDVLACYRQRTGGSFFRKNFYG